LGVLGFWRLLRGGGVAEWLVAWLLLAAEAVPVGCGGGGGAPAEGEKARQGRGPRGF